MKCNDVCTFEVCLRGKKEANIAIGYTSTILSILLTMRLHVQYAKVYERSENTLTCKLHENELFHFLADMVKAQNGTSSQNNVLMARR